MSRSRENPLSIDVVGQIDTESQALEERFKRLGGAVDDADRSRESWVSKQERLLRQRRGVTREKNVPWPGANNHSWPLIDAVIRRWKPAIANLVLRSEPVALFWAVNDQFHEQARAAQEFYHWLFLTHVQDTPLTVFELVDLIAQHGKGYTRQGWEFRTERHSRLVRIAQLFPLGVEDAYRRFEAQVREQAQQTGQAPQVPLIGDFVEASLAQEYNLDLEDEAEARQVRLAAETILTDSAQALRLVYQEVASDRPAWRAISPLNVIRPPRSGGLRDDPFVSLIHWMTADDIARRAVDGFFRKEQAELVIDRLSGRGVSSPEGDDLLGRRNLNKELDRIEGVRDDTSDGVPMAPILETYALVDINGDGVAERVVLWQDKDTKETLSAFEYPYPFRDWPITEYSFEWLNTRPYGSRGIAELLSTYQRQSNTLHNARLDAAQITLAPMFKVRQVGQQFTRNLRFRPGAQLPVKDARDIEPIVMDTRPLVEFLREENFTRTLAEQYVGIFDPGLSQVQGAGRERRTATEIDAVVAQSTEVQAQDAALFQLSMAQTHRQIWNLWEDFGPERIFMRVLGQQQPKLVEKAAISGEYDIVPAGNPISTNRALILNRAREMIQLFAQDPTGYVDTGELFREYFHAHDFQLAQRLVRSDEEAAMFQQGLRDLEVINEAAREVGGRGAA